MRDAIKLEVLIRSMTRPPHGPMMITTLEGTRRFELAQALRGYSWSHT
jgi:hypothetical protein